MLPLAAKIFSLILAVISLSKSYVDFRGRQESLPMFVFWTVTWILIVTVALFPSIVDVLLSFSGSGNVGLGTFFGMAIVFLYFIVYRIYVKLERIEQNLSKAIQELALRDNWVKRP
jgi:small membrane protein